MQDIQQLLSKSVSEIKRLREVNRKLEHERSEPIAIVGAACRYPGGIGSTQQLWQALSEGRDCIERMSDQRWPMQRFLSDDPHQPGSIYSDAMGLLDGIDRFDPAHFGLKLDEARHIDPQHRLLMEMVWETIEDAGHAVESYAGSRTGVYVGIMSDDYGQLQGPLAAANYYIGAGIAKSCAAGRLAFTFGLEGPALALDTACSSSLVSVHLAVQALRRGECDAALAGGVNLILSPQGTVVACRSQMLSRSGRCQTFDAGADGYVRSEGCGLVLLKRLSDARRDGDRIQALIRGSAVNHDGRSQGLTAPSGQAQRRVIAAALADAGVAPAEVDFVECHGTGTALGDPIEVRAIQASYIEGCQERKPLWVGALKSNLGHMESAAGIGGLHKAMQVVRHRQVPKNLHFREINPQIKVDQQRLRIAAEPAGLADSGRVLAGVSSFGFSGTNAHVILESYQDEPASAEPGQPVGLFRLAAASSAALVEYAGRYLQLLEREGAIDLPALCRTAATGRGEGACRIAFTVDRLDDLRSCLEEFVEVAGGDPAMPAATAFPSLWIIGGQTDVDWTLARRLYHGRVFYRAAVARAYACLEPRHPDGLAEFLRLLEGGASTEQVLPHAVHRWALAQLLLHVGLSPRRVAGFGFGEYVAAAVAGLLTEEQLLELLVTGAVPAAVPLGRSRCEFVSTLAPGAALPAGWQGRAPVPAVTDDTALLKDFAAGAGAGGFARIELAQGLGLQLSGEPHDRVFRWVHGDTNRDTRRPLESLLAQCYMAGLTPDWERVFEDQPVRRIGLPGYPFQRERVWTDWGYSFDASLPSTVGQPGLTRPARRGAAVAGQGGEPVDHPILTSMFACPSGARNFSGELSLTSLPYLAAHRVLGEPVVPASVYIDLILAAGRCCWPGQPLLIEELQLLHKCVPGIEPVEVYCHLRPAEGVVEVHSRAGAGGAWQQHAKARLKTLSQAPQPAATLAAYQTLCDTSMAVRRYYQTLARSGLNYGADFQGIFELSSGPGHALAKIALPPSVDQSLAGYLAHPILLDACLQAIAAASGPQADSGVFVPSQIKGIRLYKPLPDILRCLVEVSPIEPAGPAGGPRASCAALTVLDTQGECVMSIDRFETTRYLAPAARPAEDPADWFYEKRWVPDERFDAAAADRPATTPVHWLLLSDQRAACDALEAHLLSQGDRVTVVCLDDPARPGRLKISLASPADMEGIFEVAEANAGPVDAVIYGWSLAKFDPAGSDDPTPLLDRCAKYPLWLCQAVLQPRRRGLDLSFLTRGSQPAGDAAVTQPLASLLWGHVTSFVNENGLQARLVDLDPGSVDDRAESVRLARTLRDREEGQFALRNGRRLLARLQAGTLRADRAVGIDPSASYLITGGFGALGLETARQLVRQGARHLVLTGRHADRHGEHPVLDEIRAAGAHIHPLQADIADTAAFTSRLAELLQSLPPLKGVVHSAGVLADGVMAQQTWERYLSVFAPKVTGTLNLYRAVRGQPLDFFILYSSAAALLGNPGQANYAAANAFLDSFAWYLRGIGAPGLSINWGGWSQIGMAAGQEHHPRGRQDALLGFIRPEQGAQVIARLFASSQAQLALLPLRLEAAGGDDGKMPYLRRLLSDLAHDTQAPVRPAAAPACSDNRERGHDVLASLGRVAGQARRTLVQHYLNQVITELLQRSGTLDDRASLFDLGLDSLLGIDLRQRLEKDLDCSLASTLLHDHPTLAALTDFLFEQVVGQGAVAAQPSASPADRADRTVALEAARPALPTPAAQPATARAAVPVGAPQDRDIAIVGISGRYPGAPDLQTFWDNLCQGRDAITPVPADRWDHEVYFDRRKNTPGKSYSAWGGFIEGVDQFDPAFFNISPRMAAFVDPKERLFLETVWHLMEDAAYTREHLRQAYRSKVGVFVGAMYQLYGAFAGDDAERAATALSSYNAIAHRVSYFFDLRGPSVAVDTMCSSSLTAVHLACQGLLDGDCELAIAGGVNLTLHPDKYVGLSQAQIVGSHPDSRSFSDGDGFLPAEGVGAVLLKPLARARQDGDRILAVIKASSINHGGRSTGFFAPNADAQVQLIEDNFRKAGIDPASISYVEAAANGASLGDATELRALSQVFAQAGVSRATCPIGTVKSNIGHPEAASGIAQLTKVILQLQHRTLVPSIKAEPRNPNIDLAQTPFHLLERCTPWPSRGEQPRRATVSSFGAGGANAHLIIEEFSVAPSEADVAAPAAPCSEIVVLSAPTDGQLEAVARRLLVYLDQIQAGVPGPDRRWPTLANIAHTLQTGREAMDCRLALLVGDLDELRLGLRQFLRTPAGPAAGEPPVLMHRGNLQEQLEIRNLLSGKAGAAMAQVLVAEAQLEKLMLHWVQGGTVPWEDLRRGQAVQHLALPTYPFARSRYWLSGSVAGSAVQPPLPVSEGAGH
ncbi:SDR family NAD(P)-dependent oxidoreductase [Aquabacterium sp. A7-Y]|uniref:SDR family NAD(P)-dependent oxidoreductase n=1 Tax=Aquabacterium sp. A7-Y TaxID=1349605 RepID=UPI00223CB660|nr:SDR family NAD(P)-dependent oxidoreductase [Aquabacterium sp. A7-Y]MCW7538524.1 SDR family NAD(P)-dependent oxidoreductase [Aquabacterium sp. A7-Y]